MIEIVQVRALRTTTGDYGTRRVGEVFSVPEKGDGGAVQLEAMGAVERYHPAEYEKPQPWPLKMAPELYLERYPDGKHADLARQIVG